MAELIAKGTAPHERWRRPLPAGQAVVLGRAEDGWAVPWDELISRRHAEITWSKGRLRVHRLPTGRNPIFLRGREADRFGVRPGDHFVIGRTTFLLSDDAPGTTPGPPHPILGERAISPPDLDRLPFRDAPHQMDVLCRLPDVISGAADDADLGVRVVSMLLAGVRRAEVAALIVVEPAHPGASPLQVLHWEGRLAREGDFRPSHRLAVEAIDRRQQPMLHVWGADPADGAGDFTLGDNFDWAFCIPVPGEACKGWGIYVTGRFAGDPASTLLAPWETNDLAGDMKFARLVAATLSSLRQLKLLQRKQNSLTPFFSPAVLRALAEADPATALRPRPAEVTVLFCDLRGFSRQSAEFADKLEALLERVSKALGVMTQSILDEGGVIGDFQGDAAMGFWGWPLTQPDKVERACLAALTIHIAFQAAAHRPLHPLADFQAGIGIATGPAVAGQIGTTDQVKVTVFGPVVNLASRLEGMTKILRAPVLLDEATAAAVRAKLPPTVARCRRLARVKPYGLDEPLTVTELLPPAAEHPGLSDDHLAHYEAALDAFLKGDWPTAYERLHQVPPHDRGKDFLTGLILRHNHTPPPGWDGIVPLESKG